MSDSPFVGGTWLNTALVAFELTEAYSYFRKYRADPSWTRGLVASVVLVDIVGTLASFALVYQVGNSSAVRAPQG
mgnify:CR=1 FL=1